MASTPPPPEGMKPQPSPHAAIAAAAAKQSALDDKPSAPSPVETRASPPATSQSTSATPPTTKKTPDEKPFSAEDSRSKMSDEDARMIREAFSLDFEGFARHYDERHPPSLEFPYSPELGVTFNVAKALDAYGRQINEQAARLALDYAGVDELTAGIDRELAVELTDILAQAENEPSDYTDVMFGHPTKELVLARTGHMVRILAQKKAGKTTFCMEVIRCSITGEPAFGSTEIAPLGPDEKILFVDPELSDVDYKHYVRQAFGGLDSADASRIKRLATTKISGFDLMTKSTRDELIRVCNEHNITRIILDSYSKLMLSGSVSKEADVKVVLQHWSEIQAATQIQESFWVGHINNTGEARSSGSILWDASFQALFHLSTLSDGTRTFSSQQGRMTAEVNAAPIYLDATTKRPIIDFDTSAHETRATVTPADRKEATESRNELTIGALVPLIVEILGDQAPQSMWDDDGAEHHDRYGGMKQAEIHAEVLNRWSTDTVSLGRQMPAPHDKITRQAIVKSRNEGLTEQVGRGPKSATWLTKPRGEAMRDELREAKS